ncbi:MAG: transposase [Desulfobacterales bacterium]|uniref:Transposase n=1 Tax=Candidatus Desulfaltia bathyphila TaxID=2841697 RepID=A0A8J6N389_9BACT|nr:transposase [Candidatus Desulfaltia bathyphila]MBL7195723.1 transposase [Desulfobacterales bacterium]MBL7207014.1 transposase [Desulfobacterales bacterium]
MYQGHTVFSQILDFLPMHKFRQCVNRYNGNTSVRCDQIILLSGFYSKKTYPEKLRRVKYFDIEIGRSLNFFTNQFSFPALTIAELYRYRWQVEIFFKWIKQHLRIKAFYGTTENAVKTQIWIAIAVYVLVAIMKKRMQIDLSFYTILQILSITLFEKKPILQVLTTSEYKKQITSGHIQLNLFDS